MRFPAARSASTAARTAALSACFAWRMSCTPAMPRTSRSPDVGEAKANGAGQLRAPADPGDEQGLPVGLELDPEPPPPAVLLSWTSAPSTNTWFHENDVVGLERPCNYGARGPLSLERLSALPDGRLAYRMKVPSPTGEVSAPAGHRGRQGPPLTCKRLLSRFYLGVWRSGRQRLSTFLGEVIRVRETQLRSDVPQSIAGRAFSGRDWLAAWPENRLEPWLVDRARIRAAPRAETRWLTVVISGAFLHIFPHHPVRRTPPMPPLRFPTPLPQPR